MWSNVLEAVKNGDPITLPGFTTETYSYYKYDQVNGNDAFITPNNDGLTTYDIGKTVEQYYFTGIVNETTYTFDGDGDGDNKGSSHFWGDLGETVGGALETAIGVLGEPETVGASTFLVGDGADRVLSNGYNLWHDIFPKNSNYNRIPSSLGAQIGASYFGPSGEKWGGIVDDAATMFITGGPLDDGMKLFDTYNNQDYGMAALYWLSGADGVKEINEDINSVK